jgi:hypothetical protein
VANKIVSVEEKAAVGASHMQPVGVHPNLKTEVGKLTETGADSLDAEPGWRRTTDGAPHRRPKRWR